MLRCQEFLTRSCYWSPAPVSLEPPILLLHAVPRPAVENWFLLYAMIKRKSHQKGSAPVIKVNGHYHVLCSLACYCSDLFCSSICPDFWLLSKISNCLYLQSPTNCPVLLIPSALLSALLPCGWILNTLTQDIHLCLVLCLMEFPNPNPMSRSATLVTGLAVKKQHCTSSQVMDLLHTNVL